MVIIEFFLLCIGTFFLLSQDQNFTMAPPNNKTKLQTVLDTAMAAT